MFITANDIPQNKKKRNSFPSVDQAKHNADLAKQAAGVLQNYMNYTDPLFDPRSIEDERFKRDNVLLKLAEENNRDSVVILRDQYGRCDV